MNLFLLGFKIVYFSNPFFYLGVTTLVFLLLWISFNILDELLFFTPILYFYLPADAIIGFFLTIIISIMLAIVVAMNIYLIRHSNLRIGKSWISGSFLGVVSSVCASCSSIGFLIISTFGGVGIIATVFFTNYQIQLRIVSILLMIYALYTVCKKITSHCNVRANN
jgi:hypothetical protein